ncbi:flavoprotein [Catellatospora chokoriensis]|uniref:Flavoprotein n=1 Tax=Catellatospora chokoriensis TaxID=310353 RepID=A0A8J3K8E9_9ACTN|nr:flavoprotein [Catellatospora chokoriensis]GIF90399.1 flavoprotein [Catellatospora chokoriensis]
MTRSLLIITCGAGPASDLGKLVTMAHDVDWEIGVIATQAALPFLEQAGSTLAADVRSDYRPLTHQSGTRTVSDPDALIIAPATYNTVNKLAAGIADNYALTSAAELIGRGVPTVVVPFVNSALAARVPFKRSVIALRDERVYVLLGAHDGWEPHEPGTGTARRSAFPWSAALAIADRLARGV